jgi:hypothetical protein
MIRTDLNARYERPAAKSRIDSYPPGSFNRGELKGLRGTTVLIPRQTGSKKLFKTTDKWGNIVANAKQPKIDPRGFNKGELKGLKGVSVVIPKAPTAEYAEKSLQDHFSSEKDPSKMNDLIRGQPSALEEFRKKYDKATTDRIMGDLANVLVEQYGQRAVDALKDEDWDDVKDMLGTSTLIGRMANKAEIKEFVSSIPGVAPAPAPAGPVVMRPPISASSPGPVPLPRKRVRSPRSPFTPLRPSKPEESDDGVESMAIKFEEDEKKGDEIVSEFMTMQTSRKENPARFDKVQLGILQKAFNIDKRLTTRADIFKALQDDPLAKHLIVNYQLSPMFVGNVDKFGLSDVMKKLKAEGRSKLEGSSLGMKGSGLSSGGGSHYHPRTHFVAKHAGMRDYL